MNFQFTLRFLLAICLIPSGWGYCDIIYNVSFSQTSASLTAGSTIGLSVFFDEVVTGGDSHRLTTGPAPAAGLVNADFAIARAGTGTSAVTAAAGNAGFDNGPTVTLGPPTTVIQSILLNDPVFATDIGGGTYRIQIGTLTVTAGGNIGDSNVFTLQDFDTNAVSFLIDDGFGSPSFAADAAINFGAFTLTVVPEPSSLALVGLTCFGATFLRRRK